MKQLTIGVLVLMALTGCGSIIIIGSDIQRLSQQAESDLEADIDDDALAEKPSRRRKK